METREGQLSSSYEYIVSIPKPRRVQANPVLLVIVGSLPIASIFLIYSGVQTIRSLQQIWTQTSFLYSFVVEFIFTIILIAISGATYRKLRRDVTLLRDGEL